MSHRILLMSLRTLLIHGLLLFSRLCLAAAPDTLFRASTKSSVTGRLCNLTWDLQLPVWPMLLNNSTHINVCLNSRSRRCSEDPTVGWANGSVQHDLVRSGPCVSVAAPNDLALMIRRWTFPDQSDNQYQEAKLTLSGSGFKQEIRVFAYVEGTCQIVEVISRQTGPDRSLQSLVFALILPPQPSNMKLQFEESAQKFNLSIDSLNKTGRYVKSNDTEQITFDVADLKQLARRHGMQSDVNPRDVKIRIYCRPASANGARCKCNGLATEIRLEIPPRKPEANETRSPGGSPPSELSSAAIRVSVPLAVILLLVLAASTRPLANFLSSPKILVVSLDSEVAALCGQLASLPLPGLRLSLLQGHRLTERSLQRALRRDSSTAARTFLLAGIGTALAMEDCSPAVRIGLTAWRTESARFSLLLHQPPAAAEGEPALQNQLQHILGQSEAPDGVLRWAIVGDVEAASAYFREEQRTLEDVPEADEDTPDIEAAV